MAQDMVKSLENLETIPGYITYDEVEEVKKSDELFDNDPNSKKEKDKNVDKNDTENKEELKAKPAEGETQTEKQPE